MTPSSPRCSRPARRAFRRRRRARHARRRIKRRPTRCSCAALAASADARVETEPLPDIDWSEQWKHGIRAQSLGRADRRAALACRRIAIRRRTIVIDPGMAFGTGEHATTRGVVRLLHAVIRPGDRVADLGAGSAVLAIAAAKLGATHVAAIELDHDAIGNAEENVARNRRRGSRDCHRGRRSDAAAARRAGARHHGEHHFVGADRAAAVDCRCARRRMARRS